MPLGTDRHHSMFSSHWAFNVSWRVKVRMCRLMFGFSQERRQKLARSINGSIAPRVEIWFTPIRCLNDMGPISGPSGNVSSRIRVASSTSVEQLRRHFHVLTILPYQQERPSWPGCNAVAPFRGIDDAFHKSISCVEFLGVR